MRRYCRALGANTRLSRLTVSASALSLCRLFKLEISHRLFFQGWDGKGWIANILTTGLYRLSLAMNVKGILAYHTFRLTKVLAQTTGVSISWGFRQVFGCKRWADRELLYLIIQIFAVYCSSSPRLANISKVVLYGDLRRKTGTKYWTIRLRAPFLSLWFRHFTAKQPDFSVTESFFVWC